MKNIDEKKVRLVVLPKGKFSYDDTENCEYCDYNVDEKENFFSHKVLCGIDGKWHDAKHVCKFYK